MSDQLHVATRKGLFSLSRKAAGKWTIDHVAFLGSPISLSLVDPQTGLHFAAVTHGHFGAHLHRSDDQGKSWQEIAAPAFPAGSVVPQRMPSTDEEPPAGEPLTKPAALTEIWSLETAGADQPGSLWCGTIPGAVFRSDNNGDSWRLMDSLWNLDDRMQWFGGGKDDSGVHSICVDPRDSRRVKVAISSGGVWGTEDAGATWRPLCKGLRAEYVPPEQSAEPNFQDPHRVVACPTAPDSLWMQHHNGIFRSTDAGESWSEITAAEPSAFGFAVAVHPKQPDTAWFVPAKKDEFRVPVDARVVVSKTTDGGATFRVLDQGLPQQHAYDIVYRHALAIDSSGERLAMGSSTGGLWVTEDAGESWAEVPARLPPVYAVQFVPA